MPAIADQVATMEHDHAAALAQIDELTSSRDALKAALASTTNENLLLREQNQALTDFANETRATVETLAIGTMELLRASRRPVGGQPASKVLPFAPKPKAGDQVFSDELIAKAATLPAAWPTATEAVVAAAMNAGVQSDSGDEQPMTDAELAQAAAEGDAHFDATVAAVEEQDASNANAVSSDTTEAAPATVPINEFSRPSLAPTLVRHDDNDLPIFLKRDTAFGSIADRAIFG